jgi:hypothetical protein
VRIGPQDGHPSLTETGVRLLALLHFDADRSLRFIVQDERSRRGATALLEAHGERRAHRSLMWRSRIGARHQLAIGVQRVAQTGQATRREAFLKWQTSLGSDV